MAGKRLLMSKKRDILRAKFQLGLSHRQIMESVGVSLGSITKTVRRARAAQMGWEEVEVLDDDALERKLEPPPPPDTSDARPEPDCAYIHVERKRPGVTLDLLHTEYLEANPDGYRYSAFCGRYRAWLKKQKLSMRQAHLAGEKMFVDYSGKKAFYVGDDGKPVWVELFVAVLGASNYTYVEATHTQQSHDFIQSHMRAMTFFGGVPKLIVPDQLKSGVTTSCLYEPKIQRTYEEMARHYGTAVFPARPKKPKDKSKVEVAVQVIQRWVLARLRNEVFTSLASLNARIRELNEDLNDREMRTYGKTRRQLFEALDKPALQPLPTDSFELADFNTCRVDRDYMVHVDGHAYSVPYTLVGELVDIRLTATCVEVLHKNQRKASHKRSFDKGGTTRVKTHMPKAHQEMLHKPPSELIREGNEVGPSTGKFIDALLKKHKHPEKGYRPCVGLLRLRTPYGDERLEKACARALWAQALSYRNVMHILKKNLDALPLGDDEEADAIVHCNVRGPDYYQ